MKKLHGVSVCLLYLQTYLYLMSGERVIYKAGETVTLPCGINSGGDIEWKKDDKLLLKAEKNLVKSYGNAVNKKDQKRFSVPKDSTNDLQITEVALLDSGYYTCQKNTQSRKVELLVLQVEADPSMTLLASENLMLSIAPPPGMSPAVSWWKNQEKIADGLVLKKDNMQIEDGGTYTVQVDMGNGLKRAFDYTIEVSGFSHSPSIVYTSGKRPVLLPWIFNFKVRTTPLEKEVRVLGGNITFSSKNIKDLKVNGGAGCWETDCNTKVPDDQNKDLSYTVTNPKSGIYQMDIVLELEKRQKHLTREICVSNMTVSTSPTSYSMETNVTLLCEVLCLDREGQLCWYHNVIAQKVCGKPGQRTFTNNITAVPQTLGNWTCSVLIGGNTKASTNLTLKVTLSLFHPSGALFWVTVAVGVVILLLIVVIITVMAARCRRMRRARYRAWLLENLHQQRVCECNGFAPKRLRENV